ncbi:spermatogenesis-associated protein 22 isoform X3 [Phascolarctos cinereus]|uniref:Spermatogenesis-associated protein 22 isoform X2 n=1 Tax=Phascolarctos cinereus TaxID=38626 RepID=A0A6P5IGU9_PHACI|nr:spermatogenesis-associated protein 22 isoform X2 [Phascolarctos cinereus]
MKKNVPGGLARLTADPEDVSLPAWPLSAPGMMESAAFSSELNSHLGEAFPSPPVDMFPTYPVYSLFRYNCLHAVFLRWPGRALESRDGFWFPFYHQHLAQCLAHSCLPVPLFNQKKRARQPFTSSPGAASQTQDFPPLPTDFTWEMMKPGAPLLKKMMNAGQQSPTVSHLKQESGFNRDQLDVARSHNWSSWSHREESTKPWDRHEFAPQRKSSCSVASSGPSAGLATLEMNRRQWDRPQAAGAQGLGSSSSSLHVAKCSSQPGQLKRRTFGNSPEEKSIKEVPGCQLMLKEDDPSLRILPAVIESMKLWKERLPHWPLLFEVLGVLDSAVTSGAYGAKTFLLRDGKSTVPCVFYEIDLLGRPDSVCNTALPPGPRASKADKRPCA